MRHIVSQVEGATESTTASPYSLGLFLVVAGGLFWLIAPSIELLRRQATHEPVDQESVDKAVTRARRLFAAMAAAGVLLIAVEYVVPLLSRR